MSEQTLALARAYTDAGLCIIPIKTDGTKAPTVAVWKQYQEAPPGAAAVQEWWGNGHAPGIAVIWGKVSGNGEALDFDAPGLYEDFAALCEQQGLGDLVKSCPLVETPSGGRHLLYRCEAPVQGNRKLAQRLDTDTGAIETLIETRGEGGYTIAPGSPLACHPDNKPYTFLRGRPKTLPTITGEQRTLLLALASSFNEYVKPEAMRREPKTHTQESAGLSPGDDYNARGDYESLLERHGWQHKGGHGGKTLWQRPGKTGPGISATSNYGGRGLLHVFSSNAAPFEPEQSYSPFGVYALLEHGGDYSEAARELGRQGYGTHLPQTARMSAGKGAGVYTEQSPFAPPAAPVSEWPTHAPEALYGLAGDFVCAIEPHTEADPMAMVVQMLVFFGSVIGRTAFCTADGARHCGNDFAVIVGASMTGKKGTSTARVRSVYEAVAVDWEMNRVLSGLSSGEGLIHHVRDPREGTAKDKQTGKVETITIDEGVEDKRLLVIEPEFASVLRRAKMETSTLSTVIRTSWDTGTLRTMTKNNPAQATGAHVSIIGHITPEELRSDLTPTEALNGFGNRFLWVCSRRSKTLPDGGNKEALNAALAALLPRLQDAIDHAQTQQEMRRDDTARALWHDVYADLTTDKPGLSGGMMSRAAPHVLRLALLYALLDLDTAIRIDHLAAALALWEYCEASARFIFGDSLGDRVADDILRALREAPDGMSRTDLRDLFQKNQTAERIGQALALLAKHGLAYMERQAAGGPGRPVEVWKTAN